jgi:hypothetical protein
MKIRTLTVWVGALGLLITVPSPVNAAAKQTVKVYMTGDCADGQAVEGVDEDDCELTVNVTPKTSRRSAVLEVAYDSDEPEWEELDAGKTKKGRLVFDAPAVDEDDYWMDGVVLYRVTVKKSGVNKKFVSRTYKVAYTSADAAANDEDLLEDLEEETPEEKEFNEQMDRAQENNEKFNPQSGNNSTTQPIGDRVGKINQACGSIGMAKTKCDSVVAARNGVEALSVLGGDADRFCRAVSRIAMGVEMSCKDVMPKLFG